MLLIIYFVIAIALICIDQLTKFLFFGKSFSLIGDFLWIEGSSLNTGAAGGMFAGQMWLFITLAVVGIGCALFFLITKKYSNSIFFKVTLATLLAGIIGNLIDRIFYGGVRDFIYFKSINFYIFNFADIYLTIGAICLCVYILFLHKDAPLKRQEKAKIEKEENE